MDRMREPIYLSAPVQLLILRSCHVVDFVIPSRERLTITDFHPNHVLRERP